MTRKILCATDGTEHSKVAVVLAAELASKFGSELTICTVNVAHGGARGVLISHWTDAELNAILDAAKALAAGHGAPDARMIDIVSREPAAGIVAYAEQNGIDHIVMGTGDKRGVSRLVLGSVAADVAARAHCSVTVAR
ncbi:universal stress protein [Albidovulum sp.]|uniref:universal stress protein n=1 Tax=Albidovulum sp. TaxID=1872424 RepID=UPI001D85C7F7|nr:universal stress protein [Paracoccaceae bacterium]HPE24052.1 universal stress protein [Albidovulum sp.]MCB2120936.1 universal stress protein [Paracoccaceae bacterium]MCB2123899.1 universal stress protein [Paracoccaceae bacterium]MCB2133677.1 universal stress protein [Paracoccaceae bacterium]